MADLDALLAANPDLRYKRLIQQLPKSERQPLYDEMQRRRYEHIARTPVRWAEPLTESFGRGHDERVIEIPLALEVAKVRKPGLVLDAGAALVPIFNMFDRLPDDWQARIVHYTQAAGDTRPGVDRHRRSYVFGDLRDLEFKDGAFDRIVCVSTYEHIGMDNSRYGGPNETDPSNGSAAWRELLRVLSPGGSLLLTVPYGWPAEHGWFRVLGPEEISTLIWMAADAGFCISARYFAYCRGWVDVGPCPMPADPDEPITGLAVLRI